MSLKRIQGAVIVDNLVFTKGMTSRDARARGILDEKGDVENKIRNTMRVLEKTLEEAGTSFEHVLKATVYLADLEYKQKFLNPIWSEFFKDKLPARSCIQAILEPEDVAEIELIAVIPKKN